MNDELRAKIAWVLKQVHALKVKTAELRDELARVGT